MKTKRVYHPYYLPEEIKFNMWGSVADKKKYLDWAVDFTGDHVAYGAAMRRVVREWRFSCEHNLTNNEQNQNAWIGHAACALENNCPEWIVRSAWAKLTVRQKRLANKEADNAIELWRNSTIKQKRQMELAFDERS